MHSVSACDYVGSFNMIFPKVIPILAPILRPESNVCPGRTFKKRELFITFETIQDKLPGYLSDRLKFTHSSAYSLRSNDPKLQLDKPYTVLMKKSFSYQRAISWNDLPNELFNN